MKLGEGDSLVGVATCSEADHVLLATSKARCIRFPVDDVRVFVGRTSSGIRGIALGPEDRVISMTILRPAEFSASERDLFLAAAAARRRLAGDEAAGDEATAEDRPDADEADGVAQLDDVTAAVQLSEERFAEMAPLEDFILTIAANGLGKRTSAYDYRVTPRGGKGIGLLDPGPGHNRVPAALPVARLDARLYLPDRA